MTQTFAIEVRELRKSYGPVEAVRGIDFTVSSGEIFGLMGPNGAGKSTTISILSGLLQPSAGEARINGHSVLSEGSLAKASLGVVPQDVALYPDLSARENLAFWGKMYGLRGKELNRRVDEVLELVGLSARQKGKVGTFSGGMKRRINIGAALLHRPKVLIMDEPTVGIDPQSRRHILDSVLELHRQGVTVLYTTHYMEEARELADRIAIMDRGEIIACGTARELIRLVGEQTRVELEVQGKSDLAAGDWSTLCGVHHVQARDGAVTLLVDDADAVLPPIFETASARGVRVLSVRVQQPDLETVFLHLTGRALRD